MIFVEDFISQIVVGMVKSLYGVGEGPRFAGTKLIHLA